MTHLHILEHSQELQNARAAAGLPPATKSTQAVNPMLFQDAWLRTTEYSTRNLLPGANPRVRVEEDVFLAEAWASEHLLEGETIAGSMRFTGSGGAELGQWAMRLTAEGVWGFMEKGSTHYVMRPGLIQTYNQPLMYRRPAPPLAIRQLREMFGKMSLYKPDSSAYRTFVYGTRDGDREPSWVQLEIESMLYSQRKVAEWYDFRNFEGVLPVNSGLFAFSMSTVLGRIYERAGRLLLPNGRLKKMTSTNLVLTERDFNWAGNGLIHAELRPRHKDLYDRAMRLRSDVLGLLQDMRFHEQAVPEPENPTQLAGEYFERALTLQLRLERLMGLTERHPGAVPMIDCVDTAEVHHHFSATNPEQ